ncbi:MAG: (Fe-S)-binding protein [Proteobacteria bacterium]|nr:(Fe-S)-binding protein [Pseudomonadota bacterium]MBU1715237.1 (Fe-S)-binding protein [Pseudomonadota bacterium]
MNNQTTCAKCGSCTTVCPVYQISGRESHTARGKIHLLDQTDDKKRSAAFLDIFAKCLLCGACREVCPRDLDIPALIVKTRQKSDLLVGEHSIKKTLATKSLASPTLLAGISKIAKKAAGLIDLLPKDSGLRLKLAELDPALLFPNAPIKSYLETVKNRQPTNQKPDILYFTGCLANHLDPRIGLATDRLIEKTTGSPPLSPEDQVCCGLAAYSAGDLPLAKKLAKKNINAFSEDGLNRPILTSCASCYSHLLGYAELLADDHEWCRKALIFSQRIVEFSSFFTESSNLQTKISTITSEQINPEICEILYHDPCHLRFKHKITAPPRQLLSWLPNLKLNELPHGPQCCGHGGLFNLAHPDLSGQIMAQLTNDFASTKAEVVVSTCTGCLIQWRKTMTSREEKIRVEHLAILLAELLRI